LVARPLRQSQAATILKKTSKDGVGIAMVELTYDDSPMTIKSPIGACVTNTLPD